MDAGRWPAEKARHYRAGRLFSSADSHILGILEKHRPDTLVELGIGPGMVYRHSRAVDSYICTDSCFEFVRGIRSSSRSARCVCCDCRNLPFSDGVSDCVLAMAVLHHLECTDLRQALREARRVLRPGGLLILLEDWCFARGITPFEEEARKCRFMFGTRENHLAFGTWMIELEETGFTVRNADWVDRPCFTAEPHLARWPMEERTVRMGCFEAVRSG